MYMPFRSAITQGEEGVGKMEGGMDLLFACICIPRRCPEITFDRKNIWPRGPTDKASAYGAGDCRFESCRGHFVSHLII